MKKSVDGFSEKHMPHIIYRHKYSSKSFEKFESLDLNARNGKNLKKRSIVMDRYIEALLVADQTLIDHFDKLKQNLEYFLLTIMNIVRKYCQYEKRND